MKYFTKDFVTFFKDLKKNNKTVWMHANKKTYEEQVKKPFELLVEAVIEEMSRDDAKLQITPKEAIFRVNRDIRFSKNKSPYKTHVSAAFMPGGKKDHGYPGFYFHLGADEISVGGGMHMPETQDLAKIRRYIAKTGKEIDKLVSEKRFKKLYGDLYEGQVSKVLPPEFKEAAEKQPYIYFKQFFYWKEYTNTDVIYSDDLFRFLMEHYDVGRNMNKFFKKALNLS